MRLFDRLFGRKEEKSDTSPDNPAQWFLDWARGGGEAVHSGVTVTPESAMRGSAAVFTCVRNRSEDWAKLPCILYERLPDGGKRRAIDHPAYGLIRSNPNPYQTAFEFKQLLQAWVDLRGNGYALKEYDQRGRLVALWPVNPTWMTVLRVPGTWELFYRINIPMTPPETVPADAILHVRGMSLDGFIGLSPIAYHRETIGLGIAAQQYGAAFFGNGSQPGGILKVPSVLTKEAGEALRAQWESKFRGVDNAKKLAIFDGGMDWVQTGMDNTDAQYIETRKFQNSQIYGIYRMPPHKAGELERSTNNNIEHQGLEYVTDCLMTEFVRWEQCLSRDLLTEAERKNYFFEVMPDALLRGDITSRYAAYAVARNWGWLNVDEIRDKENMNPLPDGKGRIYLQPLNMSEAGTPILSPPSKPPTPDLSPASAKLLIAQLQMLIARSEESDLDPQPRLNGHGNGRNGHAA